MDSDSGNKLISPMIIVGKSGYFFVVCMMLLACWRVLASPSLLSVHIPCRFTN